MSRSQTGLVEELQAVGLTTLGFHDSEKSIRPTDFRMEMLDQEVKALVVGSDRWGEGRMWVAPSHMCTVVRVVLRPATRVTARVLSTALVAAVVLTLWW